ncbi:MAG: hypothetical protein GEU77_19505 [Deltaproteobacteria bacterium]|nr:hypothetical protein [Deltaproteobacteria bacterium]
MKQMKLLCAAVLAFLLAPPCMASAQPYERGRLERRDANLVGKWYSNGERDKAVDVGWSRRGLQARNEHGTSSRLETRGNIVRALDWEGGLRGHIRRDRIEWQNGTTWTRTPSRHRRLAGTWYLNGDGDKRVEIVSSRDGIQAKNERGQTSRLEMERDGDVRAVDWEGGLRGNVKRDRIEWQNGTIWTRSPR